MAAVTIAGSRTVKPGRASAELQGDRFDKHFADELADELEAFDELSESNQNSQLEGDHTWKAADRQRPPLRPFFADRQKMDLSIGANGGLLDV